MTAKPVYAKVRYSLWSNNAQRYVTLTVNFAADGTILNPRNIASNSAVGWGPWQTSYKLKTSGGDCWDVSTPGHGGLILVTSEELPYKEADYRFPHPTYGWPCNVYEFEEDCEWSLLLAHDPVALTDYVRHRNTWAKDQHTPASFMEQYVLPSMMYNNRDKIPAKYKPWVDEHLSEYAEWDAWKAEMRQRSLTAV